MPTSFSLYVGALIVIRTEVLEGGYYMEIPSPPQHIAHAWSAEGRITVRACDGIAVDDRRGYQRIHKRKSGCKPVQACTFFVRNPTVLVHRLTLRDLRSWQTLLKGWFMHTARGWSMGTSRGCVFRNLNHKHASPSDLRFLE